ncbi:hypothetical protein BJ742DRAFT_798917 [Cladochytrium replicatum]|nr:hypothetical protein BJ742DRAFT_798917 [Cladochytrium replicatum]
MQSQSTIPNMIQKPASPVIYLARTEQPASHQPIPTPQSPNSEPSPFQSETTQYCNVYNIERTCSYKITLFTKVDKGFFLADEGECSFWACYRRNYFEISAAFTATDPTHTRLTIPCFIETPQGWHSVTQFLVSVTARNSSRKNEIDLIQQTPKRDRRALAHPPPKPCEPQSGPTPVFNTQTRSCVSFERLQFKTATANNGKSKAVQQYHSLTVEVSAKCEDGHTVLIASTDSAPLIVRGRAPGHYVKSRSKSVEEEELETPAGKSSGKHARQEAGNGSETAAIPAVLSSKAVENETKREELLQPLEHRHSQAPLLAIIAAPYTTIQSSSSLIPTQPSAELVPIPPLNSQPSLSSFPWLPNAPIQSFLSQTTPWAYQNIPNPNYQALTAQPQSNLFIPTTDEQLRTFIGTLEAQTGITPPIPTEEVRSLKRKDPPSGCDFGDGRLHRTRGS